MALNPAELTRQYHDAINALDYATIERFFAEDAVYSSKGTGETVGRAAIMVAFRGYFERYPDQTAEDELIETLSPISARAVWNLKAHDSRTGAPLIRHGEETIHFNDAGQIVLVVVADYHAF